MNSTFNLLIGQEVIGSFEALEIDKESLQLKRGIINYEQVEKALGLHRTKERRSFEKLMDLLEDLKNKSASLIVKEVNGAIEYPIYDACIFMDIGSAGFESARINRIKGRR